MQCEELARCSSAGQRAQGLQDISTYARLFADKYKQELESIMLHPDVDRHFGVPLNCIELAQQHMEIVQELIADPQGTMAVLDESLRLAQDHVVSEQQDNSENMAIKGLVHARVHGLPYYMDPQSPDLSPAPSCISACHNGKLVTVAGTVVRAKAMQLFRAYKLVQCTKCSTAVRLQVCVSNPDAVEMPEQCPQQGCGNSGFKPLEDASVGYTNFQEINITDTESSEGRSKLPGGFPVVLLHDMVDSAQVGDIVEVTGVIRQQTLGQIPNGGLAGMKLILVACNVAQAQRDAPRVANETISDAFFQQFWVENANNRIAARNGIIASVCPQLCNVFDPKLALLLVLLGGVQGQHGGSNVRGNCHMLLVGDPGVGKSQLMNFAANKLASRSVATTGRGTSHAGLTAAAVKVGQQWTLQAGAMPLADGGICCIDEFGDVPSSEQSALLEAMEQQTISVAKAGLVTKLNARTSVLAAMNPIGKNYDSGKGVESNTGISGPLVSRFDIVMVLQDLVNPDRDASVADHLLELPTTTDSHSLPSDMADSDTCWSPEKLCAYVSWARRTLAPVVTPAAQAILQAYFQHQRTVAAMSSRRSGQERVTVRLLEAMVRLSQAHARLLGQAAVTAQDATAVVLLMDGCAHVVRVLSQVTGGGGSGGWGLCRSKMNDSELELAHRSLLERLELSEVKQEGYDSKPIVPASVPCRYAAVGPSDQARAVSVPGNSVVANWSTQPHQHQTTQSQGGSAVAGSSGSAPAPRGLLAHKIRHAGGARSSAPTSGAPAAGPSHKPAVPAPRAPRAPSAPATAGRHNTCNSASSVPVERGARAPSGGRVAAGPPKHASQFSRSQMSGASGATVAMRPFASQGTGSTPAGHHTGGGLHSGQVGARSQGQAHDRMGPAACTPSGHASAASAAARGGHARPPVLLQRPASANAGGEFGPAGLPQHTRGLISCNSKAEPRPRAGSAPAAPSTHGVQNSQRRGNESLPKQAVGMHPVTGMKRTMLHGNDGHRPVRAHASAPAVRFPMDEEDVDLSELI